MRCCVPFCTNTLHHVSTSEGEDKGITFHGFPRDGHLRVSWLRALGRQDSHLPEAAVVCSQHFVTDDIYLTENGLRQIATDAVPATVQAAAFLSGMEQLKQRSCTRTSTDQLITVCLICLDTDSKLVLMRKHKLKEAYETLTGYPLCGLGNLKQTVCIQCAQRLINFSRFRDKSLRASALLMDLAEKNEIITRRHIIMLNHRTKHYLKSNMVVTTLGPDHCDLHILDHLSADKLTELQDTVYRVVVATEETYEPLSVRDLEVINENTDNAVNIFEKPVEDLFKKESVPFQCVLCSEEFVDEHVYTQHMSLHLQTADGESDTSQECKPCTSLMQTSVAPWSARPEAQMGSNVLATEEKNTVQKSEPVIEIINSELDKLASDGNIKAEVDINRYTNCVVKLYDIYANLAKVPRQDSLMTKTRKSIGSCDSNNIASNNICHQNEVTSLKYDIDRVEEKGNVPNTLQSEQHCLQYDIRKLFIESTTVSFTNEGNVYICDFCEKTFKQKNLLVKHI